MFLNILFKRPHGFNESNILHGSKMCGEFEVGGMGISVAAHTAGSLIMPSLITWAFNLISFAVF